MAEMVRPLHLTLIRHGPSVHEEGCLPPADPEADMSDIAAFERLAGLLPADATWWVSPLRRTRMTADALIAAGAHPGEMITAPMLKEQDYGTWHGRPVAEIWEEIKDGPLTPFHFLHPSVTPPGGESFDQLWARVAELRQSIEKTREDHLVLIGHAMIFRALIGQAMGLDAERALAFGISPLSMSRITFIRPQGESRGSWMLDQLNVPA
ncbi:histidine phosphatase family protein [Alphaproteobacteria bacterium LSUCC0684]